jgi:hypothetical protein
MLDAHSRHTRAHTSSISVKTYHADNGIFRGNKWVESCRKASHGLTFASVESRKEASQGNLGRRQLAPRKRHRTTTTASPSGESWISRFGRPHKETLASIRIAHVGVRKMIKWKSRYKHGIYLGKPPQHSRNLAMVLTEERATEEQQKLPDLSMIKADFVGAKELGAATPTSERGKKQSGMAGETTDRRPGMGGEATHRQTEGAATSARAAAPEGAPIGNGRRGHRSTTEYGWRSHRSSK